MPGKLAVVVGFAARPMQNGRIRPYEKHHRRVGVARHVNLEVPERPLDRAGVVFRMKRNVKALVARMGS